MSFNPKRRYSAVAVLSEDLDRVVLIHKLRPDWQAGKANLPGGKVDKEDAHLVLQTGQCAFPMSFQWPQDTFDAIHAACARRELREETGLDVAAAALQLFCRLRFKSREGDDAECCFYAVKGDVDAARTVEAEHVFWDQVDGICTGIAEYFSEGADPLTDEWISLPTMPNLPYLVAMARQCLRGGDTTKTWPLTIYEAGAV